MKDGHFDHWQIVHASMDLLGPPQRPTAEIAGVFADLIRGHGDNVLLLGVTVELASLGDRMIAVDISPAVIARQWRGEGPDRKALVADWRSMPLDTASASAAIGDGSLNCVPYDGGIDAVLREVDRVARPGARMAFRVYCTPERGESLDAVRSLVLAGGVQSFHALKWRIAMALTAAAGRPDLAIVEILAAFERMFPDREALAAQTGWRREVIDTIDNYRASTESYCFPTLTEITHLAARLFADVRAVPSGSYPLAERCPIVTFVKRG
jgi:SAM-dependent methyltransferase